MQTYPKKRIELFIEAPILRRILERIENAGVTGYTVFPAIAGSGQDGQWTAEGHVGSAGRMVAVVCIVDPAKADSVLSSIFAVVSQQIGIVNISDVAVIRPDRF